MYYRPKAGKCLNTSIRHGQSYHLRCKQHLPGENKLKTDHTSPHIMNKTIIININGTIFHIEEDAYEVLKNYMTDVQRHFADAEDSLEIPTDIENLIAE